ncbi:MAG: thioredoxin [marine bacterium B5-7]|nr:MAG: thioredoxin [marine bacterium B5-7]
MKQWQLIFAVFVVALLSVFGGHLLHQYLKDDKKPGVVKKIHSPIAPKSVLGAIVEDFSLSDSNGNLRSLSEWKHKVIVLNFWATWCAPCREEIPAFVELQELYESKGLQFVGIALQEAEEVRGFMEEFNVNYPSLVGGDEVIQAAKRLGNDIGALPYTVIINTSGEIVFTRRGPLSKIDAESVINTLL